MNTLEQKYLSSREVAEMVEKEHKNLIRDIRTYTEYLTESNFEPSDYFIEDTYKDSTGRTLACFKVTKKGCEFIAHKMTGQKGAIFTAKYIERFHEMQDALQKPMTQLEIMQMSINQLVEQERRMNELENRLDMIEAKSLTVPNEYFTVTGFASIRNRKIDMVTAKMLGKKAAKLSKEFDYPIGKVPDERFGHVNTYHVDILNKVM